MEITVRDTGFGISNEDIPNLFQEFSKAKDDQNLNPNGIGLGLFICKRIVQACGGEIWVSFSTL